MKSIIELTQKDLHTDDAKSNIMSIVRRCKRKKTPRVKNPTGSIDSASVMQLIELWLFNL